MIVDTDGEKCVTASFVFGGDAITRQYEIQVLQYDKSNDLGGPPGCLQYYIANKVFGKKSVKTFNWNHDDNGGVRGEYIKPSNSTIFERLGI